jgi:hypothetical protein
MTDAAALLLTVKDAFVARDGAVEVMPPVPSDRLPGPRFDVTLRGPDGTTRAAQAEAMVAHIRGSLPPMAMVRLKGVTRDEVPDGTVVFVREG